MAQQTSVQLNEDVVGQLKLLIQTEVAALTNGPTSGSSTSHFPSGTATQPQTGSAVSGKIEPPPKWPKTDEEGEVSCPVMMRTTTCFRCQVATPWRQLLNRR